MQGGTITFWEEGGHCQRTCRRLTNRGCPRGCAIRSESHRREGVFVTRKRYMTVLVAVLVTALFVVPGIAFSKGGKGGGGNGTQSPPPTNPPCDSDHHLLSLPKGLLHKCGNGGSTGGNSTNATTN